MRRNSMAIRVVNSKIEELHFELCVIQKELDRLFCDGMDDIDMPEEMRRSQILMKIDKAGEPSKERGRSLIRRYGTLRFAIKNLKEVRDKLMV